MVSSKSTFISYYDVISLKAVRIEADAVGVASQTYSRQVIYALTLQPEQRRAMTFVPACDRPAIFNAKAATAAHIPGLASLLISFCDL